MEVKAKLKRLRISPRKVRLVIDVIRGREVAAAEQQLQFLSKRAALPILKLLRSAIANAENNFKLSRNNLYIKKIVANEGPTLKRYQPRAFGRAAEIRKRSSHVEIVLAERKETKPKFKAKGKEKAEKKEKLKVVQREEIDQGDFKEKKKTAPKSADERKPFIKLKEIKDKLIHRTGEK